MKIIAFIPIRGGSKSIPNKNIKLFCGKPLIYWSMIAACRANLINEVIIATDSLEFEAIINNFGEKKTKIYQRKKENAEDESSTESVMLEYIKYKKNLREDDVFVLIQATNPFITSEYLDDALYRYSISFSDSMLSCARMKRFFWGEKGMPMNYDLNNRPRRQDFKGILIENGSFYINKIKNVKEHKNRLSGSVSIYEMPDYTSFEIDEPDDWIISENLMIRNNINI